MLKLKVYIFSGLLVFSMKKKIKRICGVLLTVLLIFGMVQYAGYRLKPKSLENTYCQIQAFHMLPDNSVDVMVYGSSHCWNGFDVNVLTQQYGISAYNYSCMWQHMNTTRLFLKDSLKYLYLISKLIKLLLYKPIKLLKK